MGIKDVIWGRDFINIFTNMKMKEKRDNLIKKIDLKNNFVIEMKGKI